MGSTLIDMQCLLSSAVSRAAAIHPRCRVELEERERQPFAAMS
jgi:hypothetical protein